MVLSGRNDLDSCTSPGWRMVARQNPHLVFAELAAVTRQYRLGDLQVKWSGRKDLNLRPPGPELAPENAKSLNRRRILVRSPALPVLPAGLRGGLKLAYRRLCGRTYWCDRTKSRKKRWKQLKRGNAGIAKLQQTSLGIRAQYTFAPDLCI